VEQRANDVVRSIYQEAAAARDKKQREALAHHALASESEVRRKALVASTRNEPGIPVLPGHLDQAPWLFNILNGTLDLQGRGDNSPPESGLDHQTGPGGIRPAGAMPHVVGFFGKKS